MVRKKFSPYVENGNLFLEAYASEMAYEAVSRIWIIRICVRGIAGGYTRRQTGIDLWQNL